MLLPYPGPNLEIRLPQALMRPYRPGDGPAVRQLLLRERERLEANFPRTFKTVSAPGGGEELVQDWLTDWAEGTGYGFGLWHPEQQTFLGQLSLKEVDRTKARAEVGYYVSLAQEGSGLMTKALAKLLEFGFSRLQLREVFLRSLPANTRSCLLAERCGFTRQSLVTKDFKAADGQLYDVYYYTLSAAAYKPAVLSPAAAVPEAKSPAS